ncbi:MAG: sulfatase-like hydrolase/transferase, partial [Proteobacteria bacterium]|nr:sulfatase-like hydrolase/transferase [Pseudomonadota bacterium]
MADTGSATGPNVLLIIADTLRADHVGAYGAGLATTPSLDALAADGGGFVKA